jgi:ABC-type multidrug transport system permease subunit
MSRRRIIAITAGTVTTIVAFVLIMSFLVFAEYREEKDRIIIISLALGPVLMVAVMVGYSVWWGVLFLLSLILPEERPKHPQSRSTT